MSRFRELLRYADAYAERGHRVEVLGACYLRVTDAVAGNVYYVDVWGNASHDAPDNVNLLPQRVHHHFPPPSRDRRPMPRNGRRINRKARGES